MIAVPEGPVLSPYSVRTGQPVKDTDILFSALIADGDLNGVTSAWGRRLLRWCRPLCATTASRRAVLRARQSSHACRHTCWPPRALSLAARLADALLLEVVVVVRRKVSMLVVLLRLVAASVVGEVVRDVALICEQHQMRAR